LTDEELVSKIVSSKNTGLFEVLYERFSRTIYNKCYSFVNNEEEAKDLTQDIFLKLFVKLSSFHGKSKFSTWVYSFTYNHCVNYVTRNPTRKYEIRLSDSLAIENYSEEIMVINEDFVDNASDVKLNQALNVISLDDKSILMLKYQKNLTIKNIESLLGIGSSAVKMRLKRAKERLAASYTAA
jgi:RNA polymerase sigma-70 factor (ECF subfamily)